MNYLIGYQLVGDAALWSASLSSEISEALGTWKLHESTPPHITLFRPFEVDDIASVKGILQDWSSSYVPLGIFTLSSFGRFDDRVVFADVDVDTDARRAAETLKNRLAAIPGMPQEDFPLWRPHVTLARHMSPQEIERIWEYVQDLERPSFVLPFDAVTLFHRSGERGWSAEETFFRSGDNLAVAELSDDTLAVAEESERA